MHSVTRSLRPWHAQIHRHTLFCPRPRPRPCGPVPGQIQGGVDPPSQLTQFASPQTQTHRHSYTPTPRHLDTQTLRQCPLQGALWCLRKQTAVWGLTLGSLYMYTVYIYCEICFGWACSFLGRLIACFIRVGWSCVYLCTCIYIYIYRERERERKWEKRELSNNFNLCLSLC